MNRRHYGIPVHVIGDGIRARRARRRLIHTCVRVLTWAAFLAVWATIIAAVVHNL